MRLIAIVPNCITSTNICLGFVALLAIHHSRADVSVACIMLGMLCDGLDGYLARRFKVCSAFGKELDNLADMSLFCIAPAVLLYTRNLELIDVAGAMVCMIYVLCGALRLARFAANERTEAHFEGLPTPAAALLVLVASAQTAIGFASALVLISSGLMLSHWPIPHPMKSLERLQLLLRRRAPGRQPERGFGHPLEETHPPAIQI